MMHIGTKSLPISVALFVSVTGAHAQAQTASPQPLPSPPTAVAKSPAPATTSGSPSAAGTTPAPPATVETIVVTARPNNETTRIDRTTYDVRTNPEAPVSPAIDVIAKLPGIFVGPNNRISLAGGAYVTILVDGRPMLRDAAMQIPAERIASIEVISNPSAEFASSSEAIINIILKKTPAAAKASGSFGIGINTADNKSLNASIDKSWGDWGLSLSGRVADTSSNYRSSGVFRYLEILPNNVSQVATSGLSQTNGRYGSGFVRLTHDFSEFNDLELSTSYYRQTGRAQSTSLETASIGTGLRLIGNTTDSAYEVGYAGFGASFTSEKQKDYKFETSIG
jgi:ferric enterobactin receptor